MNLHSKQWFVIHGSAETSYTTEELEILWDMFTSDQLDFVQEMCSNMYKKGYQAALEDNV